MTPTDVEGDVFYLMKLLGAFATKKKRKTNAINVVNNIQHPYWSQLTTTAQTAIPHVTAPLTITEHRNYLTQHTESWLEKHRTEHRIDNARFIEPDDYKLMIDANSASVQCSCHNPCRSPKTMMIVLMFHLRFLRMLHQLLLVEQLQQRRMINENSCLAIRHVHHRNQCEMKCEGKVEKHFLSAEKRIDHIDWTPF